MVDFFIHPYHEQRHRSSNAAFVKSCSILFFPGISSNPTTWVLPFTCGIKSTGSSLHVGSSSKPFAFFFQYIMLYDCLFIFFFFLSVRMLFKCRSNFYLPVTLNGRTYLSKKCCLYNSSMKILLVVGLIPNAVKELCAW